MKGSDFEFLDNMQEMVLIEEADSTIKYVNRAFCQFYGMSKENVIGKRLLDFIIPEDRFFLPICRKRNISAIATEEDLRGLCDGNVFDRLVEIGVPIPGYMEAFNEFHDVVSGSQFKVQPFDGIMELLEEAAAKLPVYIVTSNIYEFPNEMLTRHGITGVKDILSGEKEASKVKKIDGIKAMYPNEKIYFITDTTGDVIEARESLADEIIAVAWGWHDRERLEAANADIIFDSVREFETYVKKLF